MPESTIPPVQENTEPDVPAMENEIRLVSRFHTLTLIRILLSVFLFIYECMGVFYNFGINTGLYLLLFLNLTPWLLDLFLAPYVKKTPPVLPYLRKQYHYSSLRFLTNNISFLLTCFLLLLWQSHQSGASFPFLWLSFVPSALAIFALLFRILGPVLIAGHIRRRLFAGQI